MKIRLISAVFLVFAGYLIVSFSSELWHWAQKGGEIEKAQLELETLKTKNQELTKQLEYVQSSEFVEQEAREKLGMAKEGETVLVLPENLEEKIRAHPCPPVASPPGDGRRESSICANQRIPNWQKWWRLFF